VLADASKIYVKPWLNVQFSLASAMMQRKLMSSKSYVSSSVSELVSNLPSEVSSACTDIRLPTMDFVYSCKWLPLGHYRIENGNCVAYHTSSDMPVFGVVKAIIFCGKPTDSHICYAAHKIRDHHPSVNTQVLCDGRMLNFVQTRYAILQAPEEIKC
jgi:hypothetical protein